MKEGEKASAGTRVGCAWQPITIINGTAACLATREPHGQTGGRCQYRGREFLERPRDRYSLHGTIY